jgi:hypothetical protein
MRMMNRGRSPMMGRPQQPSRAQPVPNQGFGKTTAAQMLQAGATPQAVPNAPMLQAKQAALQNASQGSAPVSSPQMGAGLAGMSPTRMSALQNVPQGAALKKGGSVKSSASKRADGCAQRGKTRGKMV